MLDRQAYVDFLVDHYQNPRNTGPMPNEDVSIKGGNPGCGDVITIHLKVDKAHDRIEDITFEGEGCTISQASASVLTEMVEGKSLDEIEEMGYDELADTLGREIVESRPKCATLSLDTLKAAVRKYRHEQRVKEIQENVPGDGRPSPNDPAKRLGTLLQSWIDDEDAEEQKETGEYLIRALDEDRPSDRKLFPPELKGVTW